MHLKTTNFMRIKKSIICKGVEKFNLNDKINKKHKPIAGDVAIFEVLELGKHDSIQSPNGNNAYIFPGDQIMMAFGNRYATGQFEGYVPKGYLEKYQILGKGGAVGEVTSMNYNLIDIGPTDVKLVGYVTNEKGNVLNTKYLVDEELSFKPKKKRVPKIILSIGSSMDSGKTTTAGYLARGLMLSGKQVAFIKLTGTVYSKDKSFVRDCGAEVVFDFSTFGFPSTYMCSEDELLNLYETLLNSTAQINPDYVVMEIADGLLQRETAMLLDNTDFMNTIDGIVFSCGDSLSALSGIKMLDKFKKKLLFICGLFTTSPLLVKEVQENCEYPVFTLDQIADPVVLSTIKNL